jgi:RNA polymerase sigma factor (sigma-70 family)
MATVMQGERADVENEKVKDGYLQKNAHAAAEILREKKNFIYAIIRANRCEQDAEDIYQNLFLSLVATPIPEHIECVDGYLYRAVINDIKDICRKKKAHQTQLHKFIRRCSKHYSDDFLQTIIIKEEFLKIFYIVETKLPPHLRVPFRMRYKQECTITEISQTLGVKENVVRVYLSYGLKKIRELIKVEYGCESCF